ncbi:MAG: histidine kinase [Devosia sp.]|uniref:ATP-binding protein n=1 Tax=Devosia sp. TaxID=1871048 RepID=UPI0026225D35|nr:ATP-binding protein [Devosia sp.]MDB5542520.1 histidine kinase [Devosia sp.]
MTETSDLRSVLMEVLDAIMELQQADFGDIQLYDEAAATLTIVAHRGLDPAFLGHFKTIDAGDGSAWGLALRSGHHIVIEDATVDPTFEPHHSIAASTGSRGLQSTPLYDRNSGKPIGILSTRFRQPYRPTERDLRLTGLFARQAADVIGFRLADERRRKNDAQMRVILDQVPAAAALVDREGRLVLRGGPLGGSSGDATPSQDRQPPKGQCGAAPSGAVSILQDIEAEKRARGRLVESEARLQAAVDLVKLGLYEWDPQTHELRWDETVKAMWGLQPNAEVDYDLWLRAVHPDDVGRIEAAIRHSTDPSGDGAYDVEYRVIGIGDGIERWVATRGQTIFENGKAVSFYGVAINVTDQKRLEAILERRVEARTQEFDAVNRQLRAQIEQREVAEAKVQQLQRLDAIGQITSGVAHDFNNLLTVVLTNARLLSRTVKRPDDKEGVDLILAAAERGTKLTAQLMAFSRKQRLEPQAVTLNDKIEGMLDLLGVTLGDAVHVETALDPHLWPALVDPTQIELIILNLAINARDAMQAQGTLTLETSNTVIEREPSRLEEPAPGDYVALTVRDTGAGIADDVLPRVFEPFFTTKPPGKGSGLGLAQVFGVAKQSGGGVQIATQLGKGTSLTIYLPRAPETEGALESPHTDADASPKAANHSTVLVVDDDRAVLTSTLRMLDFLGYSTVPASSGAEALALLTDRTKVDLVLADYTMPDINGVDLARSIHDVFPELPVVLVTGNSNVDALGTLDASRILHKPYAERDLAEALERARLVE